MVDFSSASGVLPSSLPSTHMRRSPLLLALDSGGEISFGLDRKEDDAYGEIVVLEFWDLLVFFSSWESRELPSRGSLFIRRSRNGDRL